MKTDESRRWGWLGGAGQGLALILSLVNGPGQQAQAQAAVLAAEHPLAAIDAAATRLAAVIDGLDVEHRWRGGTGINWRTGLVQPGELMHPSHSGEFVAAACDHLGIDLLHPPEHASSQLAAAQAAWLVGEGKTRGWQTVGSRVEAQSLANQGFVVVALFRDHDLTRPGLAALVRPSTRGRASVASEGPDVALAGHRNHNAISLRAAFATDPAAAGSGEVVLYAHDCPATGASHLDARRDAPGGSISAVAGQFARVVGAVAPGAAPVHLAEVLTRAIPLWVSERGRVEKAHLLALAADPRIKGEQAAALAACLHYLDKGKPAAFSADQFRALADEHQLDGRFLRLLKRLPEIRRTLFVDGRPHLDRIQQGAIGDCYLVAGAGWMARYRPRQVVEMIHPLQNGRFEVNFRSGEHAVVDAPTDTEILYAETSGSLCDGLWLAVIEKAVGVLAAEHDHKEAKIADPTIRMGNGGSGRADVHRWTGHPYDEFLFRQPGQTAKAHHALIEMERRHLMAQASVAVTHPRAPIPMGHSYAVLGFNPSTDIVTVWNPWGDDFTPKGPAGVEHGWPRKHGIFEVPFPDFARIFFSLAIERP